MEGDVFLVAAGLGSGFAAPLGQPLPIELAPPVSLTILEQGY